MATDDLSIDEVARRRYEQFWAEGTPHPIEEFLPDRTNGSYLPTLEELVLIDMEFSWKSWANRRPATASVASETSTGPPQVETYVNRFAIRDQSDVIRQLV